MSRIQELLAHYGESHRNPVNKSLHWLCIPLIIVSLLGLVWSLPPIPFNSIEILPGLQLHHWPVVFLVLALVYYLRLSIPLAAGAFFLSFILLCGAWCIHVAAPGKEWFPSILIFAIAWVGQFIGHGIEGKKPSFLEDIQYFLIGPAWLIHFLCKKAGIRI